jgi:hypothetical protein
MADRIGARAELEIQGSTVALPLSLRSRNHRTGEYFAQGIHAVLRLHEAVGKVECRQANFVKEGRDDA